MQQQLSQSHTACNCPIQRACKICASKHPTGLHGFWVKKKGDNSTINDDKTSETIKRYCATISDIYGAAVGSGQVLSMCVVPFKVQGKEPHMETITFIMLDTCSQETFAIENLMNQLGKNGIQTSIDVRTQLDKINRHLIYWMVYPFQSS